MPLLGNHLTSDSADTATWQCSAFFRKSKDKIDYYKGYINQTKFTHAQLKSKEAGLNGEGTRGGRGWSGMGFRGKGR